MELLNEFIVVVVLAVCIALGAIIKHSLPFISNKYIPLILGGVGVLLNVWYQNAFDINILLGGLASGLAATGLFEAVRNLSGSKE